MDIPDSGAVVYGPCFAVELVVLAADWLTQSVALMYLSDMDVPHSCLVPVMAVCTAQAARHQCAAECVQCSMCVYEPGTGAGRGAPPYAIRKGERERSNLLHKQQEHALQPLWRLLRQRHLPQLLERLLAERRRAGAGAPREARAKQEQQRERGEQCVRCRGAQQQAAAGAPVRLPVRLPEERLTAQEHAAPPQPRRALRVAQQILRVAVVPGVLHRTARWHMRVDEPAAYAGAGGLRSGAVSAHAGAVGGRCMYACMARARPCGAASSRGRRGSVIGACVMHGGCGRVAWKVLEGSRQGRTGARWRA